MPLGHSLADCENQMPTCYSPRLAFRDYSCKYSGTMIAFERLIVLCIIAARVWAASSDFGHADGLVRSPAPDGASPTG